MRIFVPLDSAAKALGADAVMIDSPALFRTIAP